MDNIYIYIYTYIWTRICSTFLEFHFRTPAAAYIFGPPHALCHHRVWLQTTSLDRPGSQHLEDNICMPASCQFNVTLRHCCDPIFGPSNPLDHFAGHLPRGLRDWKSIPEPSAKISSFSGSLANTVESPTKIGHPEYLLPRNHRCFGPSNLLNSAPHPQRTARAPWEQAQTPNEGPSQRTACGPDIGDGHRTSFLKQNVPPNSCRCCSARTRPPPESQRGWAWERGSILKWKWKPSTRWNKSAAYRLLGIQLFPADQTIHHLGRCSSFRGYGSGITSPKALPETYPGEFEAAQAEKLNRFFNRSGSKTNYRQFGTSWASESPYLSRFAGITSSSSGTCSFAHVSPDRGFRDLPNMLCFSWTCSSIFPTKISISSNE